MLKVSLSVVGHSQYHKPHHLYPISPSSDYIDLANVIVAWYNEQHGPKVALVKVTGGHLKYVVYSTTIEMHYVFDMDVLVEPHTKCLHYQGVVVKAILKMPKPRNIHELKSL